MNGNSRDRKRLCKPKHRCRGAWRAAVGAQSNSGLRRRGRTNRNRATAAGGRFPKEDRCPRRDASQWSVGCYTAAGRHTPPPRRPIVRPQRAFWGGAQSEGSRANSSDPCSRRGRGLLRRSRSEVLEYSAHQHWPHANARPWACPRPSHSRRNWPRPAMPPERSSPKVRRQVLARSGTFERRCDRSSTNLT